MLCFRSQQKLQLALSEVSPEDLAMVSSNLPKFVLEAPQALPAKPKSLAGDLQEQDAPRRQVQGTVRMPAGVPDRSKSYSENPPTKPASIKHPRNQMDPSVSDRDDHRGEDHLLSPH